jgi:hypothetical protein
MTCVCRVIRRFGMREGGRSYNHEVQRCLTLPGRPAREDVLDFADGGSAKVHTVHMRPLPEDIRGVMPAAFTVHCYSESGEALPAAIASGWLPVEDVAREAMSET